MFIEDEKEGIFVKVLGYSLYFCKYSIFYSKIMFNLAVEKYCLLYTMDIAKGTKINKLLACTHPSGLLFSEWLRRQGYSYSRIARELNISKTHAYKLCL